MIRIISARRAIRGERRLYERQPSEAHEGKVGGRRIGIETSDTPDLSNIAGWVRGLYRPVMQPISIQFHLHLEREAGSTREV